MRWDRSWVVMIILALWVVVGLPGQSQAQRDFSKVEIGTTQLTDGLYMLTGAGGNIGVSVGKDGLFLIDDQFAPSSDKNMAALKKLSEGPIRFVLNTHWHGDHTGGNENMGNAGAAGVSQDARDDQRPDEARHRRGQTARSHRRGKTPG